MGVVSTVISTEYTTSLGYSPYSLQLAVEDGQAEMTKMLVHVEMIANHCTDWAQRRLEKFSSVQPLFQNCHLFVNT